MDKNLRHMLSSRELFSKIIDYASKTGYVDVDIDSSEKWNHSSTPEIPHEDGSFDVEGHSSCDINASYYIYPFHNLDDLISLFNAFSSWVRYSWEFKSLSFMRETWPFKRKWSQWAFVLDSFDSFRYSVIEESPQAKELLHRGNYKSYYELLTELVPTVTNLQIHEHLINTGHLVVSAGVYVHMNDPTCMVFDNSLYPFDMKTGWSSARLLTLLSKFFEAAGYHVNIRAGDYVYPNTAIYFK